MSSHLAYRKPGPRFNIRRDQDSIQISSPADRMFWVRVLTDTGTTRLTVTDFKRSSLSDDDLIEALYQAIEFASHGRYTNGIDFIDIVPSRPSAESAESTSGQILDLIQMVVDRVGIKITKHCLRNAHGKYDLSIETISAKPPRV